MTEETGVSKSRFHMWRTLFAIAHADNIVTEEEIAFMAHVLEDIEFSDAQTAILKDDIHVPKDAEEMFKGITSQNDRIEFFEFARDLVWVDGDFGSEEQSVMIKLYQAHFKDTKVDDLVGTIGLELEDDQSFVAARPAKAAKNGGLKDMISSFSRNFLSSRSNDD